MKSILLGLTTLFCLNFSQSALAESRFLDQPDHARTLFYETWRGAALQGRYIEFYGKIWLDVCGVSEKVTCELIVPPIPIEGSDKYTAPLLKAFKAYRKKIAHEADSRLFAFYTGGSTKNNDVAAMDALILDLQTVGFSHWVFLTEKNLRELGPEFETPAIADGLFAIVKKVLSEPLPTD